MADVAATAQATGQIYNDGFVTNVLLSIISFLFLSAIALVVYIWNQREKEYKENRAEDREYKLAVEEKFVAINGFIVMQTGINAKTEERLKNIGPRSNPTTHSDEK